MGWDQVIKVCRSQSDGGGKYTYLNDRLILTCATTKITQTMERNIHKWIQIKETVSPFIEETIDNVTNFCNQVFGVSESNFKDEMLYA